MTARGFTLIEMMVAIAIISISIASWLNIGDLQRVTAKQQHREALVRAVEDELERAVACTKRACLGTWAARTQTDRPANDSWVRARIKRAVAAGPGGTTRVSVSAEVVGDGQRIEVERLVWAAP